MSESVRANYFSQLNYTLANEDTGFELALLDRVGAKRICAVCGSGGRSLPLLAKGAESLTCIDLAPQQLALAELKEKLYKLSRDEILEFWALPPRNLVSAKRRKEIFYSLDLSPASREGLEGLFSDKTWASLIYEGKWERTFAKISKLVQFFMSKAVSEVFNFDNPKEQFGYFEKNFDWRWRLALRIVGNSAFFNALLYRGDFIKKNTPGSHYDYYRSAYSRIFKNTLASENFFAQLSFQGRVLSEKALTVEFDPTVCAKLNSLDDMSERVKYLQANIVEYLASGKERFDFVSYSDVPSYFRGETESQFMQMARPSLEPGAHIVLRHYLRIPENMALQGFKDISSEFKDLADVEKTQMYHIQVLRYEG